jgi:uncharacterized protein (TIGR03437 family)
VPYAITTSGESWLSLSRNSGDTTSSVTATFNTDDLSPGLYESTIIITAEGTSNGEVIVPVSLVVTESGPIGVTPQALAFVHFRFPLDTAPQTVRLVVPDGASGISVSTEGADWLVVTPDLTTGAASLSVDVETGVFFSDETRNGEILIECENYSCAPRRIPVRMLMRSGIPQGNPVISSGAIVNGASFLQGLTPGSWISIFGESLSATTRTWADTDFVNNSLPVELDNVRVWIGGLPAAVHFISPNQINVQVPNGLPDGWMDVVIGNHLGLSRVRFAYHSSVNPGFFTFSVDQEVFVAAIHPDGVAVGRSGLFGGARESRPAAPGGAVSLYGTGFGRTDPPVETGTIFIGAAPLENLEELEITIGGVPAKVLWAGISGAGLYQINIEIPDLPPGDYLLEALCEGVPTQANLSITIGAPTE